MWKQSMLFLGTVFAAAGLCLAQDKAQQKPVVKQTPIRQISAASGKEMFAQYCAPCHGADAKGNGEFPRLAGQLNDYLASKLTNWTRERGQVRGRPDISAIMVPTTHNLTQAQIAAVAAYVSTLK